MEKNCMNCLWSRNCENFRPAAYVECDKFEQAIRVRDCLDLDRDCLCIMYRCESSFNGQTDFLCGYASYHSGDSELTSEDGDNYSLNDIIQRYEWVRNDLIVWI